jgi:hypothetical protein
MRRIAIAFLRRYRSELLMCAFIAQVLVSPLAESRPHLGELFALLILLQVLAGASYMASRRVVKFLVIPLVGLWFVTRALEAFGDSRHLYAHLSPIAGLAVSCAVLWGILRRFGTIPRVTSSVIAEAFISYMVIAIAFSQLYWLLNRLIANPFNQHISISQSSTLLYFSMITLTGVGYGGIIPINPYVRLIAAFENMVGIFFIAVVVARLVSSYRSRDRFPADESDRSGTP